MNPAIASVKSRVEAKQGSNVELSVYASGYPVPTESNIAWWGPDHTEITEYDEGVEFQNGHKTLMLTNVHTYQSGSYKCLVSNPGPTHGLVAETEIYLKVYGEV